jgi:hypothetical protein
MGKRIDQLTEATTLASTDLLLLEYDPSSTKVSKKITVANFISKNPGNLYINGDYVSGDEDSLLSFNAGQGVITWDQGYNFWTVNKPFIYTHTDLYGMGVNATVDNSRVSSAPLYRGQVWCDQTDSTVYGVWIDMYSRVSDDHAIENCVLELRHYGQNGETTIYGEEIIVSKDLNCTGTGHIVGLGIGVASNPTPDAGYIHCGILITGDITGGNGITLGKRLIDGILVQGDAGWTYGYRYRDTDNATDLFYVNQYGGVYSAGTFAIANGTPPGAHTDNQVIIYSVDSSDATSTLGLMLEQAVESIGTFTASHKIKVKINGTEYWIQLDAV